MKTAQVRDILLIGHSFVYLVAFTSLYWQTHGLYGENGLLPIASKFACDADSCKATRTELTLLPFLINILRLAPSFALQMALLFGIITASLSILFARMRNAITYFMLFLIHSSAFQVGDTFLWFQWDTLLLEAGALCCLLAPFPFLGSSPADNISIFLIRWLVFRLMYASGVVKLTSQCPSWWSLTALNIHFESQCLPTWVAYYAHHSPEWLRRLSVAVTFYIEIALPPMFLLPFKSLRLFSFYPQILLMLCIMLTGNYNFFNALYALHCMAVLNDSDEYNFGTKAITARFSRLICPLRKLISLSVIFASLYYFIKYFKVEVDGFAITSKIAFSRRDFAAFVEWSVRYLLYVGIVAFIAEVVAAIIRYWTEEHRCRVRALIHLIYVIVVGSLFFSISLVSFSTHVSERFFAMISSDLYSCWKIIFLNFHC
uniref:Lipase maturation factor n=1 Tax=Parascaris univalens TaxID=6257 RepID=A0A915AHN8_PARUN